MTLRQLLNTSCRRNWVQKCTTTLFTSCTVPCRTFFDSPCRSMALVSRLKPAVRSRVTWTPNPSSWPCTPTIASDRIHMYSRCSRLFLLNYFSVVLSVSKCQNDGGAVQSNGNASAFRGPHFIFIGAHEIARCVLYFVSC